MPILPPSGNAPYDNLTTILNSAKIQLGRKNLPTLAAVSAKILDDWTQPSTQQATNNAWRKFQQYLGGLGFTQLKQEWVISNLPAFTASDPVVNQYITWSGFFDGLTLLDSPYLPYDLIQPLKVWERATGQNQIWPRDPIPLFFDGLPGGTKQTLNGRWEWRAGAIFIPGAMQAVDLRILGIRNLGDFADDGLEPWFKSTVPISDCQAALADFICAEVTGMAEWLTAGQAACRLMLSREVSMKQRGNIRRQSRSGRLEGYGW